MEALGCEKMQLGLACVGGLVLLIKTFKFMKGSFRLLRNYVFRTYPDFKKYGKWAVVTGGTSGIGKEIALQFAGRGIPLVIISRDDQLLRKTKKEIETKHGVEVKTLKVDFKEGDFDSYDKIEEFLKELDIGILVNNVGQAPPPKRFLDLTDLPKTCHEILNVNVLPMWRMCQIVMPGMKQRRRGLVLNLSSISAILPLPYMALYGSTKSLVNYFTQALSMENKEFGIEVQSIMPAFVRTNMTLNKKWGIYTMEPEFYAKSVLATVEKDRATHGCIMHELQALKLGFASEKTLMSALEESSQRFYRRLEELRKNN